MQFIRQLFSYYNPLFYALLLALILLLRWPSFDAGNLSSQEAYYALAAKGSLDGRVLYAQTHIAGPPLMVAAYVVCIHFLGVQYGLLALKVLACILIYVVALLLNSFYNTYRFSQTPSTLPSVLFVLAVCLPWYGQEVCSELVLLLPFVLVLRTVLDLSFEKQQPWLRIYAIGIVCCTMLCIAWQGWLAVSALLFMYTLMCRPTLRDVFTLIGGALTVLLSLAVVLKMRGNLEAFMQWAPQRPTFEWQPTANTAEFWKETAVLWLLMTLIGLVGILFFRSRFYAQPIRQRRAGDMMLYTLLAGMGMLLLAGNNWQFRHAWMALVSLSFFASYWIENGIKRHYQWVVLLLLLVSPAINVLSYRATLQPEPYAAYVQWAYPAQRLQAIEAGSKPMDEGEAKLFQTAGRGELWLLCAGNAAANRLALDPGLGLQLHYLEPKVFARQFPAFAANAVTIPADELRLLYHCLVQTPPACIIDCEGRLDKLQAQAPLVLQNYSRTEVGGNTVFVLKKGTVGIVP